MATPPPPVVVAVPAKPAFPELRLQGIIFRSTNPLVLINGRTLTVGDEVDGAKITAVDKSSVKVEFNGETRTLRL